MTDNLENYMALVIFVHISHITQWSYGIIGLLVFERNRVYMC